MCKPTTCTVCGKTTWTGCGMHIGQVRAMVAADQWCDGYHPEAGKTGWLRRLFARQGAGSSG